LVGRSQRRCPAPRARAPTRSRPAPEASATVPRLTPSCRASSRVAAASCRASEPLVDEALQVRRSGAAARSACRDRVGCSWFPSAKPFWPDQFWSRANWPDSVRPFPAGKTARPGPEYNGHRRGARRTSLERGDGMAAGEAPIKQAVKWIRSSSTTIPGEPAEARRRSVAALRSLPARQRLLFRHRGAAPKT
jgi:hypothetical protein